MSEKDRSIIVTEEDFKNMVKSIYKSVLKSLRDKRRKEQAREIVEDILDPDFEAEVNPSDTPPSRDKVLLKKQHKYAKSKDKGVKKLKKYISKKCNKDEPIPGLSQK